MAKKAKKKAKKKAGKGGASRMTTFSRLVAHANALKMSPVCYKVFPDGSAQVCKLMPDGTYGDCQRYDLRPVPGPRCG